MSNGFQIVKLLGAPVQVNLNQGFTLKGDYDNTTAYVLGDIVTYQGSSYVAVQATTGNLPTNSTYWQLIAEKGNDGSFENSFETISKNLKAYSYTLNYTSGNLTSIVYNTGSGNITKTLNYIGGNLSSIVLSGSLPIGTFALTKTLNYTSGTLTSITYT